MVKHLAKVSVAGNVLPAVSYPSRRPKPKNLRFQHLRRFVMLFVLARQNLSFEPAMQRFAMPRAPHCVGLCVATGGVTEVEIMIT